MKSRDISSELLRWVTQTCTFNFHHRVRRKNECVIILCHSMSSVPHVFITQPSLTSDFSPNGSAAACFHGYRRRVWKDVQEWLSSQCLKSSDVIADIVWPVYHFIRVSLPPAASHHVCTYPLSFRNSELSLAASAVCMWNNTICCCLCSCESGVELECKQSECDHSLHRDNISPCGHFLQQTQFSR